jgi:hypothetical protein
LKRKEKEAEQGENTEAKHRKTTWRTPDAAVAFPPSAKRIQINTRGKIRSGRWNESERNEQKAKKGRLEVRKKRWREKHQPLLGAQSTFRIEIEHIQRKQVMSESLELGMRRGKGGDSLHVV